MSTEKTDLSRRGLMLGASATAGALIAGMSSTRAMAATQATSTSQPYSFNVTDYGADTSGAIDSTQAFLAAIAAAAALGTGGGHVLVPTGRYKLSQTIVLPNYVSLCGPGTPHSATLDFSTQQSGPGIRITGYGHAAVEGLCIYNTAGNGVEIAAAEPFKNFCHLRDVYVLQARASGFVASDTYMTTFERCWARECHDFGFYLAGFHTSIKLDTCWADRCGNTGFNLNAMVYATLNNCGADSNGSYGYFLSNCQGIVLNGCGAEDNFHSSIGMAATDAWAANKKQADGELRGITINSFFSLQGNKGNTAGYGTYMTLYTENSRKIEGSSLNHFVMNDGRALPEVAKLGSNYEVNINFPVMQGAKTVG